LTISNDCNITLSNPTGVGNYYVKLIYGGYYSVNFTNINWINNYTPEFAETTPEFFKIYYDGTTYYGTKIGSGSGGGGVTNQSVTISSGVATVSGAGKITLTSESGTTDQLDKISGLSEGDKVTLLAASDHTITVVRGSSLYSKGDFSLSNFSAMLFQSAGDDICFELSRSENTGRDSWLSNWGKRREITIDTSKVDSDLTHFPIPLFLGTSVGQTDADVSSIFDEIGSNSKKIAITKSDGITQLYGEIEHWDAVNEKAVIWISKSDLVLSSTEAVSFYIYYDSTKDDNTSYIGDVGDTVAKNVWDDNFKAVYHMSQDPSTAGASILDSTGVNNGTPSGMDASDLIDGVSGKALSFTGGQYIDCGMDDSIRITSNISIEAIAKLTKSQTNTPIVARWASTGSYLLIVSPTNIVHVTFHDGSSKQASGEELYNDDTYHYFTGFFDGSNARLEIDDGAEDVTGVAFTGPLSNPAVGLFIGSYSGPNGGYIYADISEVRVSNTDRSDAWRKATYYSCFDNFITFKLEETK
jgi:hypothetical protein